MKPAVIAGLPHHVFVIFSRDTPFHTSLFCLAYRIIVSANPSSIGCQFICMEPALRGSCNNRRLTPRALSSSLLISVSSYPVIIVFTTHGFVRQFEFVTLKAFSCRSTLIFFGFRRFLILNSGPLPIVSSPLGAGFTQRPAFDRIIRALNTYPR